MLGFRAVKAFDGQRALPGGALVLIDNERIVGVEPAAATVPVGCPVVDVPDATLLPGLIDTHTHLCCDSGLRAIDQLRELSQSDVGGVVNAAFTAHLDAGTTTVRDLGDIDFAVLRHRGERSAPTVLAAGPPITSKNGHCALMGGEVAGIDEIRAAVRERAERGVDVVKIMTSGGMMTVHTDVTACQFTLAEVRAAVDEAHRHGLPITAHAHALPAVQMCLAAGVDGIEHGSCLTEAGLVTPPELVAGLAAAGTVVCPTLGRDPRLPEPPPHIRQVMERTGMTWQARLDQVGVLHRGGVRLIGGADSGINPGKPHGVLPHTVADQVAIGMTTAEALAAVTSDAAAAIGLAGRKGRLAVGHDADLLFVRGDPLADITALQQVHTVVLRGRVVRDGSAAAHPS